jgi:uncharacterized membrane protein YbhN (UPF0104 family)
MSAVDAIETKNPASKGRNLLKTLPGIAVSLFFLWYTFFPHGKVWFLPAGRGISVAEILAIRAVRPAWLLGILGFTAASYTLRCVRWTRMMRSTGARFGVCARVLMTSLAANNILPLRIGDIMRVFTYSGDLGASPSVILSTVILEKLLDIFILVLLFTLTMGNGTPEVLRAGSRLGLEVSTVGLIALIFGARPMKAPLESFFAKHSGDAKIAKVEHWIMLALDCLLEIGIAGSMLLLLQSAVIWFCEGMIFVSAAKMIGLATDWIGPWQAVSWANLSYLVPSSPGSLGPFEFAVKTSLVSHGASEARAALYALALHAWLLISVTGAGGLIFLMHRAKRPEHKPLIEEIETLPTELP